jgi:hypothetical protein
MRNSEKKNKQGILGFGKVHIMLIGTCFSFFVMLSVNSFAQGPGDKWLPQISQDLDSIMSKDFYIYDDDPIGPTTIGAQKHLYLTSTDSLMNTIYKFILHDYKSDTAFIPKFVFSQKIWMEYRDAELDAIMPPRSEDEYGAYQKICRLQYKVALTKRRIEELLVWYRGQREGTVCESVSYKWQEDIHRK